LSRALGSGARTLLWAWLTTFCGVACAAEPEPEPEGVSARDLELIEDLDLLLELELLQDWEPGEDLPLPLGENERSPASLPSRAPATPEAAR
jgi:hypothetical protein